MTKYSTLRVVANTAATRMAKVGLTSTVDGQRVRCHSLPRFVSLYLFSTWPAHPTAAVPVAMVKTTRTNRVHRSHKAFERYADSSAEVAELRE